jgi:hypothetical protein
MRKIFFVMAMVLFGSALSAEETPLPKKESSDAPTPGTLVRERTIYVPYDQMKNVFEKDGRGVFLPYEEFLKLWEAGKPKPPATEPSPPADAVIAGGTYVGKADEATARFYVTYTIRTLKKGWSETPLSFWNAAVEKAEISDPEAVLAVKTVSSAAQARQAQPNSASQYVFLAPKPGEYVLKLTFAVRIQVQPGRRTISFGIPASPSARLDLLLPGKDLQVEVEPAAAASNSTTEGPNTRVAAVIGNAAQVSLRWMPPAGVTEKGEATAVASQNVRAVLGERILRMEAKIVYRIERHEKDFFRVNLPPDLRLVSVKGPNLREWTIKDGELQARLHSGVKDEYALELHLERPFAAVPESLTIQPPGAADVLREDGYLVFAHDPALRVRIEETAGLSQLSTPELPVELRAADIFAGFRRLAPPSTLKLRVEEVKPVVRSSAVSLVVLGADEDQLIGWVDYQIEKAGVFKLHLKTDVRWEPLAIGDEKSVEDFQSVVEGAEKLLTINLKNRALGALRLPFKFTGPGRAAEGEVELSPPRVSESAQDKGVFGLAAPRAFKAGTVKCEKAAAADVRKILETGLAAQLSAEAAAPLLAYAYNRGPASARVRLERQKQEIRVTGLHAFTVAESGLEGAHTLRYQVEFAAAERLRFSLPSALDDVFRVECPGFKEKKKVSADAGRSVWDVFLQDKVLGVVALKITHKEDFPGFEPELPRDVALPDVRGEDVAGQLGFIVIRNEGLLEISPKESNIERTEPTALPPEIGRVENIYAAYRYFRSDRALALTLVKHETVETGETFVNLLRSRMVVTEERKLRVRTLLNIENRRRKLDFEFSLPAGVKPRQIALGGREVTARERRGKTLIELPAGGPFLLQLDYELSPTPDGADSLGWYGRLNASTLELPPKVIVNKIETQLYVPENYFYFGFSGTLHSVGPMERVSRIAVGNEELGDFVAMGKQYGFRTMAPVGRVSFFYVEQKLFRLLDALAFAAALLSAWWLVNRRRWSAGWVSVGYVLVPLCLTWFVGPELSEPALAWCAAGVLFGLLTLLHGSARRLRLWREARLAVAPDPYLEEAEERPAREKPTAEAPKATAAPDDGKGGEA